MSLERAYLTKSRYMAGLQCAKRLWRQCFDPLPHEEPAPGSPQDIGQIVGRKAHLLFPGGVLVDRPPWEHRQAVAETAKLVADPDVPAIFEATFEADGVRVRVDVLERLPRGKWGIREVKASTSVKPEYLDDVAIQLYVLERAGLRVLSVELIHIDSSYERGRDGIDWAAFFTRSDVTADARAALADVPARLTAMRSVLRKRGAPSVEPGGHCWNPYGCEFWDQCTQTKPADWIFNLPRISERRLADLAARGIESIAQIPDDVDLTYNQRLVRDVIRSGRPFFSDRLGDALRHAGPPAAYLDFETMNPAVPLYPGTRPYQRIPFQWSLHAVGVTGRMIHVSYLADGRVDPRTEFAKRLVEALGDGPQPIIVYSGFERGVLNDLKEVVSAPTARRIDAITDRLFDLLAVVRGHVYHADFGFSHSIKNVAPVLAPTVRYDDLDHVADGGAASSTFERIAAGLLGEGESEEILSAALLEYCRRDTLAMVEVHKVLREAHQ